MGKQRNGLKEDSLILYQNALLRTGAHIYALANANSSMNLTLEGGINLAENLLAEIIKRMPENVKTVETVLELAGSVWAITANNNSSKTLKDAVDTAQNTYLSYW